jgi:hypothetical protein
MVLDWSLMAMNLILIDINVEIYQNRCGGEKSRNPSKNEQSKRFFIARHTS